MADQTDASTPQRPIDPETFARYAVRAPREIAQLLQALVDKRPLVSAFLGDDDSFVTVALAITPDGALIIDASADESQNVRAGSAGELVCTARLDNVKLQFALQTPARVLHDGRNALRAAMPESVLRLQRREYFRLPTPQTEPLACIITHTQEDGRRQEVTVRILDISGGGLAVVVPPRELAFEPGTVFERCSLGLPDGEPLRVSLKVRNLFQVERPSGVKLMRAGCEFVGLSSQAMARIQRYMFKLERDRRLRET